MVDDKPSFRRPLGATVTPQAGAAEAATFGELFQHYAPRVKGYLVRRGLSAATADEVTQEVMLTVWRKWELYDAERASVSTWIFTIARNRGVDHLRKHMRPEPDPSDPCWVSTISSLGPEPEESAVATSRAEALSTALSALNPDQREALEQLYFEGHTMDETARVAGVPAGTIKSRARRALDALRRQLRGGELDDA